MYSSGANVYVRPDAPRDGDEDAASSGLAASAGEGASATSAEQLRLRFHYSKTAFDTDLEAHPEKPWRKPRTDISDFFNYGFNEATWKVSYCSHITCMFVYIAQMRLLSYILCSCIARSSSSSAWTRGSGPAWRRAQRRALLLLVVLTTANSITSRSAS